MNIAKPRKEDFDAAWKLINTLRIVSEDLNPLKPIEGCGLDLEWLEDRDKAAVLDEVVRLYEDSNLPRLMMTLDTLMSPKNGLIDQESDVLDFSPEIKAALGKED